MTWHWAKSWGYTSQQNKGQHSQSQHWRAVPLAASVETDQFLNFPTYWGLVILWNAISYKFELTCFSQVQRNRCMLLGQPIIIIFSTPWIDHCFFSFKPKKSKFCTWNVKKVLGYCQIRDQRETRVTQPRVRGTFASPLDVGSEKAGLCNSAVGRWGGVGNGMNIRMWEEVEWFKHTFPAIVNVAIRLLFQRKFPYTNRQWTNRVVSNLPRDNTVSEGKRGGSYTQ